MFVDDFQAKKKDLASIEVTRPDSGRAKRSRNRR